MKIEISSLQSQRPIFLPLIRPAMEVLMLPILELKTVIEAELQSNPLLDVDEELTRQRYEILQELLRERYPRGRYASGDSFPEDPFQGLTREISLEEHLLQQLDLEINDTEELKIGEMIIGSLDENGYLRESCEMLAAGLSLAVEKVEKVLNIIQGFDPPGVASRNLKECLLIQAGTRLTRQSDLYQTLIADHFEDLAKKKFGDISRALRIPVAQVKDMTRIIAAFNPRPGCAFQARTPNLYVQPDMIILPATDPSEYEIILNQTEVPVLKLNPVYQNLLRRSDLKTEDIQFLRERVKDAVWFIRNLKQREQTIQMIAEFIVGYQKDFFKRGVLGLKPLALSEVARAIGRNESTVCRAVNRKYVDSPQGIFPLKYFFTTRASRQRGQERLSTRGIKEEIRVIVQEENTGAPLSDQEIHEILEQRGRPISRRAIAKYRDKLKILPSYLRKG
ncbi:MAG: RNA polymerase factor sigma-54 [Candidatus Omnitrophica bacterium]|nr:RNA polymerase factor sigma-54 [Candidatus Omnitrophota bacterium]